MPITINGSTGISGVNGSAATPAIQGGDADTGIFFGTNEASITTGGVQRLFVNSSGHVGIGKTPTQALDVSGSLHIGSTGLSSGSTDAAALNVKQVGLGAANGIYLERNGERRGYAIFMGTPNDNLTFEANNVGSKTTALSLDRSGLVMFGHTDARNDVLFFENSTNITPKVQIETVTDSYNNGLSIVNNSANGYGPSITIGTSGAGSLGSSGAGSRGNGWQNGHIHFASSEGNNLKAGVTLSSYLEGAIADNKVPSSLYVRTATHTEDAPIERLRVDSYGRHIWKYNRHHTDTSTGTYGFHQFAYVSERAHGSDGTARYYSLKSSTTMQYGGTSVPATIRLNVAYNTYHAAGAGAGEYIICCRNGSGDTTISADLFRKLTEHSIGGWYYGLSTAFSCDLFLSTSNGRLYLKVNGRTGNGSTYDGGAHIHICCEALGGTFSNNGLFEVIPLGAAAPSDIGTQITAQTVTWS